MESVRHPLHGRDQRQVDDVPNCAHIPERTAALADTLNSAETILKKSQKKKETTQGKIFDATSERRAARKVGFTVERVSRLRGIWGRGVAGPDVAV